MAFQKPVIPTPVDPGFDARLEYNASIGELIRALSIFVSSGNHDVWRRALTQLVNINPYFSEKETLLCDKHLKDAEKYLMLARISGANPRLRQQSNNYQLMAEQELNTAERYVFRFMKEHDMLLPKKSGDDSLDEDNLAKLMGLQ